MPIAAVRTITLPYALVFIIAAMAVTMQIAATLPIGDYNEIRVTLSDILLPAALIEIAWISRQRHIFPLNLRVAGARWWLLAITAAMTIALIIGVHATGKLSGWQVKKYLGWFVLVGYFALGAALSGIGGASARKRFLDWFLLTAAWTAGLSVLAYPVLFYHYQLSAFVYAGRLTGLFQNSQAFGVLLAVAFCLHVATRPRRLWWLIPPAYLCGIWFSGSRGAMLAVAAGAVALAFVRRDTIRPMAGALMIAAVAAGTITGATTAMKQGNLQAKKSIGIVGGDRLAVKSGTIQYRRQMTKNAVAMFKEAPWFGVGLGTYVWNYERTVTDRHTPRHIHNSALWLLTEFGVVGAAPIIGFLFVCLIAFWRTRSDPLSVGMLAVAVAFMAASVGENFLYQRHLWFLLGLGLAISQPKTEVLPDDEKTDS